MTGHELIERYVHEVGGYLPRRGRADIQRELQSLLQDAVEERTDGADPTPQLVSKVLLEFGKPQEMAAQYNGKQYLIGRTLYPRFRLVVGIVFAVLTVLNLLVLVIALWSRDSAEYTTLIWGRFTNYVENLLFSFGIITAIFVGIEHFFGDQIEEGEQSTEWDPLSLPPVNDPNRVNRPELIGEILFAIIGLAALVWGATSNNAFGWLIVDEFRPMIFWFVASACADLLVNAFVLWQGRWQPLTRWLEIAAEVFGLYVLYAIATRPVIFTISGLNTIVKFGLNVALVIVTIALIGKIARQLWQWRFGSPFEWRTYFAPKSVA